MEKYFLYASVCVLLLANTSQIVFSEKIFIQQPAGGLEHLQKYSHHGQKIQPSQIVPSPTGQILQVVPEFPVWKIHKYSGIQINPVRTIPYVHVPEIKHEEKPRFEAPPLDHIQSLLGTSSELETIDTLKELASTEDGLKLMANYIKGEYPESEISVKDIISMISQYKISTPEIESKWTQQSIQNSPVYQKYDQLTEPHKSLPKQLSEKYEALPPKIQGSLEQFPYSYSPMASPFKKYGPPIPQLNTNGPPLSHKFDSKSLIPNLLPNPLLSKNHKSHLPPFPFSKPPPFLKYSSPLLVFPIPPPLQKFNSHLPHFVHASPPPLDKYNSQLPPLVFPNPPPKEKYSSHLLPSVFPLTSPPPQKYGPPIAPLFPNNPLQSHKVCLTSQNINQQPRFIFSTLPSMLPLPQKYNSNLPHLISPTVPVLPLPSQEYGPPISSTNLPTSHKFDSHLPTPNSPESFAFSKTPLTPPPEKYNSPQMPSLGLPTFSLTSPPSLKYGSPPLVYGVPEMNDSSSFLVKAKPIIVLESQNTNYNDEKGELLEENLKNTFKIQSTYGHPSIKESQDDKPEEDEDDSSVEKLNESYGPPKSSLAEVDSNERLNQKEIINPEDTEEPKQSYIRSTNIYGAPKQNTEINYVAESEGNYNNDVSALSENTSDSLTKALSSTGNQNQMPNQQYGLPSVEAFIFEPFTKYGKPKVEPIENKIYSYPGYEPTPVEFFEAQKINSDISSTKDIPRVIPFSITQSGLKLHDFEEGIHILNEDNDSIKPDKIITNMWNGAPELSLPSAMSGTHQYQHSSFVPTYEPNKFMLAVEQDYVKTDQIKPLSSSEVKITQENINKDGRDVTALKYEHPSFSYTQFSKKPIDTTYNPPYYAKISDLPLDNSVHFENIPGQISSYGEPILQYIFNENLPAASEKKTTVVKAENIEKSDSELIKESKPIMEKPKEDVRVEHDEKSVVMKNKDKFLKRKWMPKTKRKESLKTTIVYAESANENKNKE